MDDDMVQAAVIRELEIIGEASKMVSEDQKKRSKDIEWRKMAGMRDKLIHGYMGVDIEAVWDTVSVDIPKLKKNLGSILPPKD